MPSHCSIRWGALLQLMCSASSPLSRTMERSGSGGRTLYRSSMWFPRYGADWFGYDVPNDHPGPVVRNALADGLERLPRNVIVRPWLQDFGYDASQVREQIVEAEVFGLGWMLWNARSNVTTEALLPAR